MNCLHYQQTLSKGMDGEVNEEAFAAARRHCAECESCNGVYEALVAIDSRIAALPLPMASRALKARAKAVIEHEPSRGWLGLSLPIRMPVYVSLILLAITIGSFAGDTLIAFNYHDRGDVFNLVAPTSENTLAEAIIELTPMESAR